MSQDFEPTSGQVAEAGMDALNTVPNARIRARETVNYGRLKTRLWWLTALCGLLAIVLVLSGFRSQGLQIRIQFQDGHGLKVGDTLRYRGIDVGDVRSIQISDDLAAVEVGVLLSPGNEKLAVAGSQFWIERARLRLGQVSGLDTVLGAKYIGVIPGPQSGKRSLKFIGLESPLNMTSGDSAEIQIEFPAGEGLGVGDPVQFRGTSVGEVTDVALTDNADAVLVHVRLVGAARKLARAGTQFWIERPRLDLTEIRGLETLLGGRYIAMQPTLDKSDPQFRFVGLAEPPPLPRRDGSLEIELDAANRMGLVRGAPIAYRGLEVGRVSNVGLSHDGATAKVAVIIDAEYADLVRENSKWWAMGGLKIDADLRGVHIAVESLSAWVRGGIAFATPEYPGKRVVTGHRFVLEPQPMPEWLDWQPRIAVGHASALGIEMPRPLRVVASWQSSFLGLSRRRTSQCWGIALSDGSLYVPADFLKRAADLDTPVNVEIAGKSFALVPEMVKFRGATASLPVPKLVEVSNWETKRIGTWDGKSILLVINPELSEPLALDATRVSLDPELGLEIAEGVPIASSLEGSPVLVAESAELLGLLVQRENKWFVGKLSVD
ncbi:MAG: MlaD family protein [bacterium]|nr:MlaD family protein [bacterium]